MNEFVTLSLTTYDKLNDSYKEFLKKKNEDIDLEKRGYERGFSEGLDMINSMQVFIKFLMTYDLVKLTNSKESIEFDFNSVYNEFTDKFPEYLLKIDAKGLLITRKNEKNS